MGGGTVLWLGCAVPATGTRLRTLGRHLKRLPLARFRPAHAQNFHYQKCMTGSRANAFNVAQTFLSAGYGGFPAASSSEHGTGTVNPQTGMSAPQNKRKRFRAVPNEKTDFPTE